MSRNGQEVVSADLYPAIDLRGGQAVRLAEGDPGRMTSYSDAPVDLVDRFADAGARRLHVVDLDGAFAGDAAQLPLITAMIERAHARGLEVEVGGGIRSEAAIDAAIDAGADFVIVGTLAIREPALVAAPMRKWSKRGMSGVRTRIAEKAPAPSVKA